MLCAPYVASYTYYCSQLAVELAQRFNGEIINGDAMQMYNGLPIITNKIPSNERNKIPHHLIDFIGLEEVPWTVGHFVDEAQKVIREIRSRGRLPILVGGTHYYTQSLLFKDSLVVDRASDCDVETEQLEEEWPILSASTEEMFAKLDELDPITASRWHPKDRRHIRRSLEICLQTGRKASDVYKEQENRKRSPSRDSGNVKRECDEGLAHPRECLRYPSLIFWLHAQDDVLKARLNARVQTMVVSGLLEEATVMSNYHNEYTAQGESLDLGKGIWVSIGYKEMQPYISLLRSGNHGKEELSRVQSECIEAVMAATRQYAKRQNRSIRLTLADFLAKADALDKMFLMDCTNLDRWTEMVTEPSQRIAEAFLMGLYLPEPNSLSSLAESTLARTSQGAGKPQFIARTCFTCDKVLMSEEEWNRHLKSSGHKKVIAGRQRRIENERRRQAAAAARLDADG
jgi:tRNA dimethylallyltransferase